MTCFTASSLAFPRDLPAEAETEHDERASTCAGTACAYVLLARMARSPKTIAKARAVTAPGYASWIALVAATTLGAGQFASFRAEIRAEPEVTVDDAKTGYRLVVQSYAATGAVAANGLPAAGARPLASTQRAITAQELREGVAVDIVQVGVTEDEASKPIVLAWVEPGEPNLEFDALRARPNPGAFYGVAQADADASSTRVRIERRAG